MIDQSGAETLGSEQASRSDAGQSDGGTHRQISDDAAASNSGLIALSLVASHHHVSLQPTQLRHELALGTRPASAEEVTIGARRAGFKAKVLLGQTRKRLTTLPLPALIEVGPSLFMVLLARSDDDQFRLFDPVAMKPVIFAGDRLAEIWTGTVVLIARRFSLTDDERKFGLSWFLRPTLKYKRPLVQVLVASLFVQICGLVTPLAFQITVDKVLVHKSQGTLIMVVAGLVLISIFQIVLQYLRTYILSHTASRIDVELGARVFSHLMRLPLIYFETRPAGQTVARLREIETIRAFLTGQGLTSAIDLVFSIVFVGVLFIYSVPLAIVAVLTLPAYMLIAAAFRPVMRERIKERFNRGAISNQFLVETVIGAHTVKALAIEPMMRMQWEDRLAAYVQTSLASVMVASAGQNVIQLVNKLSTALLLFFGAQAAIAGTMTVGELLAFNMLVTQATQPILRLSQLWQDFQQVQISVERVGDIVNLPGEARSQSQPFLPRARGAIEIERMCFRYVYGGPEVLRNVSLRVPAGQVIGVVGRSGSGKSTLTKLMQRLYVPERGHIRLDGIDLAQVDPSWLRRQIGVVLQENFLFNRSVHDNIALANPGMARPHVMAIARLAGADEFIDKLPLGYDTLIEERGANLSGGQRQRLAIARALAADPRILILDEATSALDYESERIIQNNMRQIVKGRTVIIIAHRLAAVRDCDRIIALEEGEIREDGCHDELLRKPDGIYARLWTMQAGAESERTP